jgi:hypothetical protein
LGDGKYLADRRLYGPGIERPLGKLEVHPRSIRLSSAAVASVALLDDKPDPAAPGHHQNGLGIHFPSGWKRAKEALEPGGHSLRQHTGRVQLTVLLISSYEQGGARRIHAFDPFLPDHEHRTGWILRTKLLV